MRQKLEITGSSKGYSLTAGNLHAYGSLAKRMDGSFGLTWDGTFLPDVADRERVEAVISEVMATGIGQTIVIGESARPASAAPAWKSRRGLTLTEEMDREDTEF